MDSRSLSLEVHNLLSSSDDCVSRIHSSAMGLLSETKRLFETQRMALLRYHFFLAGHWAGAENSNFPPQRRLISLVHLMTC